MTDAVATRDALRIVGQPVVRHDARDKVVAATAYAADWALPGMLHAAVLRSPYPSARIVRLETKRATATARPTRQRGSSGSKRNGLRRWPASLSS